MCGARYGARGFLFTLAGHGGKGKRVLLGLVVVWSRWNKVEKKGLRFSKVEYENPLCSLNVPYVLKII